MREYTDQEICQIIQDYDRIIQELRYVVEAFVRELASLDSNDDWLCRLLALQHSGTGSATTHSSLHDLSDLLKNKKFKGMDEFGNGLRPEGFEHLITTLRSRNIAVMLFLQSISQLQTMYKGDGLISKIERFNEYGFANRTDFFLEAIKAYDTIFTPENSLKKLITDAVMDGIVGALNIETNTTDDGDKTNFEDSDEDYLIYIK